ncbi:MAG: alpha/beta hydrolase [Bifidobacteriaceae bacterium]|jgi:pimeloyl-ACP methyl ester carboxylesterase|nr:alpha/beta hydrolase [Bifidobacteriaceae bacterium]
MDFHPMGSFPSSTVPLVFLHAFPMDHRLWLPVAQQLTDWPLLLADLPGFGASPLIEPNLSVAAEELWAGLDRLGVDRAVLVGLSMGGYLAMAALRHSPQRIAGLVLADTKDTLDPPEASAARLAMAKRVEASQSVAELQPMALALLSWQTRRQRPELVAMVQNWISQLSPEAVAWAQQAMASRLSSETLLAQPHAWPALVVVGEHDRQSPVAAAQAMAGRLACPLVIVPGAAHLTALEAPAVVAAALADFQRQVVTLG